MTLSLHIVAGSIPCSPPAQSTPTPNTWNKRRPPWDLFVLAAKRIFPLLLSLIIYLFHKYLLTPTLCLACRSSPQWAGLWGSRSAASIQWNQGQGLSPGWRGQFRERAQTGGNEMFLCLVQFSWKCTKSNFNRFSTESQTSLRVSLDPTVSSLRTKLHIAF